MAKLIDDIPNMTNRELTDIVNGVGNCLVDMTDDEHDDLILAAEDELWVREAESQWRGRHEPIDWTEEDMWAYESEKLENIRNEW